MCEHRGERQGVGVDPYTYGMAVGLLPGTGSSFFVLRSSFFVLRVGNFSVACRTSSFIQPLCRILHENRPAVLIIIAESRLLPGIRHHPFVLSSPRSLAPSPPRSLVPSSPRSLAPSPPRSLVPSFPRFVAPSPHRPLVNRSPLPSR